MDTKKLIEAIDSILDRSKFIFPPRFLAMVERWSEDQDRFKYQTNQRDGRKAAKNIIVLGLLKVLPQTLTTPLVLEVFNMISICLIRPPHILTRR
jgi:hypothetical protein